MSFTSQYHHNGERAATGRSGEYSFFSRYEKNWQEASICTDRVGNPAAPCTLSGNGKNGNNCRSNSGEVLLAQNFLSMKNANKQRGEVAGMDATQFNPVPVVTPPSDTIPDFDNPVFFEKPQPRQPESPETESFRSWLKSNSSRLTASPALLERIRTIPEDHKA